MCEYKMTIRVYQNILSDFRINNLHIDESHDVMLSIMKQVYPTISSYHTSKFDYHEENTYKIIIIICYRESISFNGERVKENEMLVAKDVFISSIECEENAKYIIFC